MFSFIDNVMKRVFSFLVWCITRLLLATMLFVVASSITGNCMGQSESSEIVEIIDPGEAFYEQCENIRENFARISQPSAAWDRAKADMLASDRDPDNNQLKRRMVGSRTEVIAEMYETISCAVKSGKEIEKAYQGHVKQLNAEISDSMASLKATDQANTDDTKFLTEVLVELEELESEFQRMDAYVNAQKMQSKDEDTLLITEFQARVNATINQLEIYKNAKSLHVQNIVMLGATKAEAAKEYLDIRKSLVHARHDQIALAGVARNDRAYLKLLDSEERLQKLQQREKFEYQSQSTRLSGVNGGYKFESLPDGKSEKTEFDSLVDKRQMSRLRKAVHGSGNSAAKADSKVNVQTQPNENVAKATERKPTQ